MCESMLVAMGPTYSCTPILDLSSRSSSGIGLGNTLELQGQAPIIESFLLVSQSPKTIISKDSNNIEKAHVLFDKEDSPPNFDVVIFLVPYDVIPSPISDPLPKPTHVAPVCVAIDVNKSLSILNVTPIGVAPTNLESPTMMQICILHHTLDACNSKLLGDYVEIVNLPLTTKNLSVPTTKQVVLGKLERHHGTKIRSMTQMAIV